MARLINSHDLQYCTLSIERTLSSTFENTYIYVTEFGNTTATEHDRLSVLCCIEILLTSSLCAVFYLTILSPVAFSACANKETAVLHSSTAPTTELYV